MSSTPRLSIRDLPMTGWRARIRWILVFGTALSALLCAVGFGFGSYRHLQSGPERLGEWRSMAIGSWFIPVLAGLAAAGGAVLVWRRGLPTGFTYAVCATMAAAVSHLASPYAAHGFIATDQITQLGYLGTAGMVWFGALLMLAEPILALLERRAREQPAPLPAARVVR